MTIQDFIETINSIRKANKNNWYQWSGTVEGREVAIKGFNTGLQIYRVDGVKMNTTCDISVKQFKSDLLKGVL
jgi:hypothetical protein